MDKHYSFAGVEITVRLPDSLMYEEERHLGPFRVSQVADPLVLTFRSVNEISPPGETLAAVLPHMREYRDGDHFVRYIGSVEDGWEKAYMRVECGEREYLVQMKESAATSRISSKAVLNALGAEHLLVNSGAVVFHCSYIKWNGAAILFTAPSGTGKSTQADLWVKHRAAEIINGDRSALCVRDGKVYAAGIPFAGSSVYCKNETLPLAAIVYLSQAPVTTIRKLRGFQAFSRLWEGVSVNSWIKQDVQLASDIIEIAAAEIPVYHLACTPDESAVNALEEMLRKQGLV